MALFSLCRAPHDAIRLMRIRDTKNLAHVWASEALLPELLATGRAQQLGEILSEFAGQIANAIAKALNDRGLPSARGGKWTARSIISYASSRRCARSYSEASSIHVGGPAPDRRAARS